MATTKRSGSGKSKLPAKKRKALVSEITKGSQEIGEEVIDNLWNVCGLDDEDKKKLCEVWKGVVDVASKFSVSMSDEDQRIIVSTMAYIVFDLMNKKVKEKKESEVETVESTSTVCESTAMLNRYAGAAMHSMITKRKKMSENHKELKFLEMMRLKHAQKGMKLDLDQGGLVSVSPVMLPFLKLLMAAINENVNNEQIKRHGNEVIKVALGKLLDNEALELSFNMCITNLELSSEYADKVNIANIRVEFLKKIFHSRVNEFMEARKELSLERHGKVTDADQSLRDTLKTYSNNQKR